MKNPYPKEIEDEVSGIKLKDIRHLCWQEGYDAAKKQESLARREKSILRPWHG